MGHIIDPNNQTLSNKPLNIRMEGDPGTSATIIQSKYISVDSSSSTPNTSTDTISKQSGSVKNALKSMVSTQSDETTMTSIFTWNQNQNTKGKISPTIFQISAPLSLERTASSGKLKVTNDIYPTWTKTLDTRGTRVFNNIYLSGKVVSDEDDAQINVDSNGDPIYLKGLLSSKDESKDQQVKDELGISDNAGIIFQEATNYLEPKLTLTFSSNSSWFQINSNTTYSYIWDGNTPGIVLPTSSSQDITEITYSVSSNAPSTSEGAISGALGTQLVSSSVDSDGGVIKLKIGNTKSGGSVTGFTFTDADNSNATVDPRTAIITYTYSSENSVPAFNGTGTFTVIQDGGDVTTPNPTMTYYFSNPVNCRIDKTSQGPQDKSGAVAEVSVTANSNSASKGTISFNPGAAMQVNYGSTTVATATSSSNGSANISVNGGTYTCSFTNINASLPSNTSSRTISFQIDVSTINDANNGSGIKNHPLGWQYTQPGHTYDSPYLKIGYKVNGSSNSITQTFSGKNYYGTSVSNSFSISSNTGDYQGATTTPLIEVTNSGTITVSDSGGTITVPLKYKSGTWEPGYTKSTDPRTITISQSGVSTNNSTSLNTTNFPLNKTITLTQAGSSEGQKTYESVTVSGSTPDGATSVNSGTLYGPTGSASLQYNFKSAVQPKRNGFTMTWANGCVNIKTNYTASQNTFSSTSSTLSITSGSLSTSRLTFTRPIVYPSFNISFSSSNSNLVNYNGKSSWSETFGETAISGKNGVDLTINDSARNIYYSIPSITGGSCSSGDGSLSFSGSVNFKVTSGGSNSSVSSTITATDQDGRSDSITVSKGAIDETGIYWDTQCSNSDWTITNTSGENTSGTIGDNWTLSFSGTISGSTEKASSCTITIEAHSSYDGTVTSSKTFTVCRRGYKLSDSIEYQWVDYGSRYDEYSLSSGTTLSCSASNKTIDYFDKSVTLSATGSASPSTNNISITTKQVQKKQGRSTTTTTIIDCSGNEDTDTRTGTYVDIYDPSTDQPITRTQTLGTSKATGSTSIQVSTNGSDWSDGSSSTVYPAAGSNESTLGATTTVYFRTKITYNTFTDYSSSTSASAQRYGVTYHNE